MVVFYEKTHVLNGLHKTSKVETNIILPKNNFPLLEEESDFAFINSSYILVINAMVPPDIPGIKSAMPIIEPLRKRIDFL